MTPQSKVADNVKALLIALLAALILRQFVLASYNVPTGSMKDTIMVGDFMFVNKFVYGARTPTWLGIPFTSRGVYLPYITFPGFSEPETQEIVVFEYPLARYQDYIKRCLGVGGQTLEMKQGIMYLNDQQEGAILKRTQKYDANALNGRGATVNYVDFETDQGKNYTVREIFKARPSIERFRLTGQGLAELRARKIPETNIEALEPLASEEWRWRLAFASELRTRLAPFYGGKAVATTDDPGSLSETEAARRRLLERVIANVFDVMEVDKGPFTVPENQFFMMGDNRDNSLDSREWGFLERRLVVGKPLMIWLSINYDAPMYQIGKKIRWDRLGTIVK